MESLVGGFINSASVFGVACCYGPDFLFCFLQCTYLVAMVSGFCISHCCCGDYTRERNVFDALGRHSKN